MSEKGKRRPSDPPPLPNTIDFIPNLTSHTRNKEDESPPTLLSRLSSFDERLKVLLEGDDYIPPRRWGSINEEMLNYRGIVPPMLDERHINPTTNYYDGVDDEVVVSCNTVSARALFHRNFRHEVEEIYRVYLPVSDLSSIDGLLAKWEGKEHDLIEDLIQTYMLTEDEKADSVQRKERVERHIHLTEISQPNVLERLTDVSNYTGIHSHRFTKDGKGRGLKGRDGGDGNGSLFDGGTNDHRNRSKTAGDCGVVSPDSFLTRKGNTFKI